ATNIKYDVIGLIETRHRPLHAVFQTREEHATPEASAAQVSSYNHLRCLCTKVIVGDFDVKIAPRRTAEKLHIGTHGMEWNEQGNEALKTAVNRDYFAQLGRAFARPTELRQL
ncbi:hypothetical protein V3C99_005204, partial [Haemonchus contortus]|uniref:Reverse transcriptase domain-containing protein n=1 Tax=Haemonchus contortus TaxID=6289 RepID=A0A7I4XWI6_HAECO